MRASKTGDWIQQKIRVTQWDNTHTNTLQQFNLLTVHSLLIDQDPEFRQLKAIIENYNMDVRESMKVKSAVNHASFRSKFVAGLYKMLSEVCQMKNSETQLKCLRDVYRWAKDYEFERKDRPVTATTRATRPTTAKTRPTSGISIVVPVGLNPARLRYDRATAQHIEELNRQINDNDYETIFEDNKSRNSMKYRGTAESIAENTDFREKSRTIHAEYQPPNKRLKDYKRKCIDLQDDTIHTKNEENKAQRKKIMPKDQPKKQFQTIPIETKELQVPKEEVLPEGEQPATIEDPNANPGEDDGAAGFGEDEDIPLDGEDKAQDDLEVIDIDEPKDKLAPRTKPYVQTYVEIEHNSLVNQTNRANKNYHKQIQIEREEQEMVKFEMGWAKAKARWQKEQSRKRQSAKIDDRRRINSAAVRPAAPIINGVVDISQPSNIITLSKQPMMNFNHFEDRINKTHLQTIKNSHLDKISYIHSNYYEEIAPSELPANRTKNLSERAVGVPQPKRFTDILIAAQNKVQSQFDDEIQNIKQRLARDKVPCELGILRSAIGPQQSINKPQSLQTFNSITGRQLPSNPFFKVAKKKKKKKK